MQEYNVVFSETANNDLGDIVEYLSNFSPNIARRYYDEIIVMSLSLSFMPQRCPLVRDETLRDVRKVIAGYLFAIIHYFS